MRGNEQRETARLREATSSKGRQDRERQRAARESETARDGETSKVTSPNSFCLSFEFGGIDGIETIRKAHVKMSWTELGLYIDEFDAVYIHAKHVSYGVED